MSARSCSYFGPRMPLPNTAIAANRDPVNNFIASGGDGFTAFAAGTEPTVGPLDLESMEAYLRAFPVVQVPATGRVTMIGG